MATLHILANPSAAACCAGAVAPEDRLLVLADAAAALDVLTSVDAARVGVVCGSDDNARSLDTPAGVERLCYRDFVAWVVACERSVTWT